MVTPKAFVLGRFELMDVDILEDNLKNPDAFIKSFEDGKYPNLKEVDVNGKSLGLSFDGTKFRDNLGHSQGGLKNFILTNDGRLVFGENHSYLSVGKNVKLAGSIRFSQNSGNITEIDNQSGHYQPDFADIDIIIEYLQNLGIDTSNIILTKKF